jgi:hypothetical protein
VEIINPNADWTTHDLTIEGRIEEGDITFEKKVRLIRGSKKKFITPKNFLS